MSGRIDALAVLTPAVVLLLAGAAHAQTTGALEGTVVDRATERPLAGVQVSAPAQRRVAISDDAGRFALADLAVGIVHVVLSGAAIESGADVEERILGGQTRRVVYRVDSVARDQARRTPRWMTVVRASMQRDVVETAVERGEGQRAAGTQGDPLKIVDSLPGVARAPFGNGQLVIWGAAPADTRAYVDGVEVPELFHVGGFRSVLNAELVGRLTLVPGGYGVAYGRGLGGLVHVETRALVAGVPEAGVHGYVGLDVLDASAFVTAPLGRRLRIALAARYSLVDQLAARLVSADAGSLVAVPQYDDYQAKATWSINPREQISLSLLASDDRLARTVGATDPAAARTDSLTRSSYRVSLRYERTEDRGTVVVTPFAGFDRSQRRTRFGELPTRLDATTIVYGLRGELRRRVAAALQLQVGVDALGRRTTTTRLGSLTVPPREGDPYVFGLPPSDDIAADHYTTHLLEVAPYVAGDLRLGPVTITPGVRLNAVLLEVDRALPQLGPTPVIGLSTLQWAFDPRLGIVWRPPSPRIRVSAAAGLYHQAPHNDDLSPVFGTPTLGLSRAVHVTASFDARLAEGLALEVTGYWRRLDGLASRSEAASPQVGNALVQEGSGRSYGAQLLLREVHWRGLSGWVSYAFGRSERRDHPHAGTRRFDFDQTHAVTVVATYAIAGWSLGIRLRYASGYPRTPVTGSFFDARDDRVSPRFGATNATQLPDFVQLDLRIDKTITWTKLALELYLDVQNVTYRRNPEEIVYSPDYQTRGFITGLPTLAVLGARVLF